MVCTDLIQILRLASLFKIYDSYPLEEFIVEYRSTCGRDGMVVGLNVWP